MNKTKFIFSIISMIFIGGLLLTFEYYTIKSVLVTCDHGKCDKS